MVSPGRGVDSTRLPQLCARPVSGLKSYLYADLFLQLRPLLNPTLPHLLLGVGRATQTAHTHSGTRRPPKHSSQILTIQQHTHLLGTQEGILRLIARPALSSVPTQSPSPPSSSRPDGRRPLPSLPQSVPPLSTPYTIGSRYWPPSNAPVASWRRFVAARKFRVLPMTGCLPLASPASHRAPSCTLGSRLAGPRGRHTGLTPGPLHVLFPLPEYS